MTWGLIASPFEFAPQASRYGPLSWAILLAGVCAALTGVYLVQGANSRLDQARSQQARLLQQQRAYSAQAQRAERDPLTLEKLKVQAQLEALLQTPWSLLLDALEATADAVGGRVTLLSVAPSVSQANPVKREIELTMAASSYAAMLAYVDAMKEAGGFSDVRIKSHQMDESIGPGAIRFRVSAGWNHLKEGVFLASDPATPTGSSLKTPSSSAHGATKPSNSQSSDHALAPASNKGVLH